MMIFYKNIKLSELVERDDSEQTGSARVLDGAAAALAIYKQTRN